MNTIEIKTDLSGEKLQVLMWELEAFCEGKQLSKPVLRQHFVSEQLPCSHCGRPLKEHSKASKLCPDRMKNYEQGN